MKLLPTATTDSLLEPHCSSSASSLDVESISEKEARSFGSSRRVKSSPVLLEDKVVPSILAPSSGRHNHVTDDAAVLEHDHDVTNTPRRQPSSASSSRSEQPSPSHLAPPSTPLTSQSNSLSLPPTTPTLPYQQAKIKPKRNRNEKFHKLFQNVPDEEVLLNAYSCAYVGDILLQGFLYISENWFCFHSRILGKEKKIMLNLATVLNITREKTALFIPNAVGVVTCQDKYVFGSLMSRDNTHSLMIRVWKAYQTEDLHEDMSTQPEEDNEDGSGVEQQQSQNISAEADDTSDSESSEICNQLTSEGTPLCQTESNTIRHRAKESFAAQHHFAPRPSVQHSSSHIGGFLGTEHRRPRKSLPPIVTGWTRCHIVVACCSFAVLLLLFSTVQLFHRLQYLQYRMDSGNLWSSLTSNKDLYWHKTYGDMYYLHNQHHAASLERLHLVLQANIKLLAEMHESLKSLLREPDDSASAADLKS